MNKICALQDHTGWFFYLLKDAWLFKFFKVLSIQVFCCFLTRARIVVSLSCCHPRFPTIRFGGKTEKSFRPELLTWSASRHGFKMCIRETELLYATSRRAEINSIAPTVRTIWKKSKLLSIVGIYNVLKISNFWFTWQVWLEFAGRKKFSSVWKQ